jgi:hypothetical protein
MGRPRLPPEEKKVLLGATVPLGIIRRFVNLAKDIGLSKHELTTAMILVFLEDMTKVEAMEVLEGRVVMREDGLARWLDWHKRRSAS